MNITENLIFSKTEKIIIFAHKACHFIIDPSITREAVYIPPAKEEWQGTGLNILYYIEEMKEAANSDKKYLIMTYEPIIGASIKALMLAPDQFNFQYWSFLTFFHADISPEGIEPNPMYNTNDGKMDALWEFDSYPFINKYTIPPGYTLTSDDIQKKHFSFYEADYAILNKYVEKQKKAS